MKIAQAVSDLMAQVNELNEKLAKIESAPPRPSRPSPSSGRRHRTTAAAPAAKAPRSRREALAEEYGRLLDAREYERARDFYVRYEKELVGYAAQSLEPHKPAPRKLISTNTADLKTWRQYRALADAGFAREAAQFFADNREACLRGRADDDGTPSDPTDTDPDNDGDPVCSSCGGSGKITSQCSTCAGTGKRTTDDDGVLPTDDQDDGPDRPGKKREIG